MNNNISAKRGEKCQSFEDKVFLSIQSLLRSSGHCGQLVSVVDEANKYCYKTVDGKIGVVDKYFIHDRIM
jgi:hypothetical protein